MFTSCYHMLNLYQTCKADIPHTDAFARGKNCISHDQSKQYIGTFSVVDGITVSTGFCLLQGINIL